MSATTSIEWTDRTWNPVRGCSVISPGCSNCYAMKQAHRFSGPGKAYDGLTKRTKAGPQWSGRIRLVEDALPEPLSWRKPQRIFVNSMSDLFHEDVPFDFVDRVMLTIVRTPQHIYQVLTKRAGRMRDYFSDPGLPDRIGKLSLINHPIMIRGRKINSAHLRVWPLPTLWLGVSVENQQYADERIPLLLQTPAAVRFISAEPLLGPVRLLMAKFCDHSTAADSVSVRRLDWVIVGGESGPGARPCDLAWIRSIVAQCQAADVACFVKQLGAVPTFMNTYEATPFDGDADEMTTREILSLQDRKGGDITEWPADLRVRQFPTEKTVYV